VYWWSSNRVCTDGARLLCYTNCRFVSLIVTMNSLDTETKSLTLHKECRICWRIYEIYYTQRLWQRCLLAYFIQYFWSLSGVIWKFSFFWKISSLLNFVYTETIELTLETFRTLLLECVPSRGFLAWSGGLCAAFEDEFIVHRDYRLYCTIRICNFPIYTFTRYTKRI
jgi:hypothetical protein